MVQVTTLPKTVGDVSGALLRRIKQFLKYGKSAPNPYKLIEVSPSEIEYIITPRFIEKYSRIGTHILEGNWDQKTGGNLIVSNKYENKYTEPTLIPINNWGFYQSIEDRFKKNVPWKDTDLYNWAIEHREKKSNKYTTKQGIHNRLDQIDELYEYMESEGYKSQKELKKEENIPLAEFSLRDNAHEVMVDIGRDGKIIFEEGKHRFCVARVLGIEKIPVRVFVRHKKWQEIRKEHYRSVTLKNSPHPDLH